MDLQTRSILASAVKALADFKQTFGRDLTPSLLAELYVALKFDLSPTTRSNEPGFDLVSTDGKRYQVKQRDPATQNVDVNNFDFDYLVLVNMSNEYRLSSMWRLPVDKARSLFVHREKFRKYQATQRAVKENAENVQFQSVV